MIFFSLFDFVQDFLLIIFLISPSHNYVTMKYHPDTIGIAVLIAILLIYLANNSRGYKEKTGLNATSPVNPSEILPVTDKYHKPHTGKRFFQITIYGR